MKDYIIIPDATCDISKEVRDYFGLTEYVKSYIHINGESMRTTLDWDNISREEFYKTLSNKKNKVTSAAPSPEEFYQVFRKYAEAGMDILSMSILGIASSTHSIASSAAERIRKEFPECNIYCFDSCRLSGSFGLQVAYALDMKKNGATFEEVIGWLEENKCRVHQMGPIDDLTFVARRGQISNGKAIMGNLVGVKPMGDVNVDGNITVLHKIKGIKKAIDVTVSYVKLCATEPEKQYAFIAHSDREALANSLKEKLEAQMNFKKVFVSDVFTGSGTNIGPGMIAVYFLGEPISEGCEKEKQLLSLAISQNERR